MHFNLLMLNLWIGLSRRDPALPSLISDLGYADFLIEKPFRNSRREEVKPELILTSPAMKNSLLFEFKSGANTETEQIQRYGGITAQDLEGIEVPPEAASSHDVVYVGDSVERDRLRIGIDGTACGFPLLLLQADGLQLDRNVFKVDTLTAAFQSRLRFNPAEIPTGYVPMGPESESWEVAEVILPIVIAGMHERKSRFAVSEIARDACHATWDTLHRSARVQIEVRAANVLQQAARIEYRDYFTYSPGTRMLTVTREPMDLAPSRRTAALQALLRAQSQLLERLRAQSGATSGEQLELELGAGEEP